MTPKSKEELKIMGKTIPVYETTVQTKTGGIVKVLTLSPTKHFVHSTYRGALEYSGYYEIDKPVGFLATEPAQSESEQ